MSTNVINVDPYLRTSWHFTNDQQLVVELTRSFNEVAIVMNSRIIGTYAANQAAITGESWFLGGSNKQSQSLRTVIPFTGTGSYVHNIAIPSTGGIKLAYGSFTNGTNWFGAIYGSSTTIAGQVSFYVTNTNVVVQAGAGAPSITNGLIVLEWLSQP